MSSQANTASLHATVSGIVQGVFYRRFVFQEALGLGLHGRVRNLPDGRVEVEAEGDRQRLERLMERLRTGPPHAQVSDVTAAWAEYRHDYDDFRVDYS